MSTFDQGVLFIAFCWLALITAIVVACAKSSARAERCWEAHEAQAPAVANELDQPQPDDVCTDCDQPATVLVPFGVTQDGDAFIEMAMCAACAAKAVTA